MWQNGLGGMLQMPDIYIKQKMLMWLPQTLKNPKVQENQKCKATKDSLQFARQSYFWAKETQTKAQFLYKVQQQ